MDDHNCEFLADEVGQDKNVAAHAINLFRDFRDKLENEWNKDKKGDL